MQRIRNDPKSAILLTGYQAEDTNGRRLLEQGYIEIQGAPVDVDCEVMKFDFSAHADHNELVSFIRACDPENVVIMHSETREEFLPDLEEYNVLLPRTGEEFELH
jgi:putative mRNA 3-end processing factor